MKPRGSLAATVLTEGKTLAESADLEIIHQANRRGFFFCRTPVFNPILSLCIHVHFNHAQCALVIDSSSSS